MVERTNQGGSTMSNSTEGDEEVGALVYEPTLTADDSEIRVGDRIIFRYFHSAFQAQGGYCELPGVVLRIMEGFQLVYFVGVAGSTRWPDLFVERRNIVKVLIRE
jgi:hypothetical protein